MSEKKPTSEKVKLSWAADKELADDLQEIANQKYKGKVSKVMRRACENFVKQVRGGKAKASVTE